MRTTNTQRMGEKNAKSKDKILPCKNITTSAMPPIEPKQQRKEKQFLIWDFFSHLPIVVFNPTSS
jgi:hypothetical protein